jgi:centromeric protein E
VYVRLRPLSDSESERGAAWRVGDDGCSLAQVGPADASAPPAPYAVDAVFGGATPTEEVYRATTQGLIRQVVGGFNSTVFAYGQTSSGKTHTMRGIPAEPGIIPLAVAEIFELIAEARDREFLLRVSYMEIYNEDIRDLLAPDQGGRLAVHESREAGVYVAGLREDIVASPAQVRFF